MKKESKLNYLINRMKGVFAPPVYICSPPNNIIIEKDIRVRMRDKIEISVNIFRPNDNNMHPVIICFHPYGKDILPKKGFFGYKPLLQYRIMRQTSDIQMSALTSWESPDPAFWVSHEYAVINGDTRSYSPNSTSLPERFLLTSGSILELYCTLGIRAAGISEVSYSPNSTSLPERFSLTSVFTSELCCFLGMRATGISEVLYSPNLSVA